MFYNFNYAIPVPSILSPPPKIIIDTFVCLIIDFETIIINHCWLRIQNYHKTTQKR